MAEVLKETMDSLSDTMNKNNLNNHSNGVQNDATSEDNEEIEDRVDPWNVCSKSQAGVDYDKLIGKQFSAKVDQQISGDNTYLIDSSVKFGSGAAKSTFLCWTEWRP